MRPNIIQLRTLASVVVGALWVGGAASAAPPLHAQIDALIEAQAGGPVADAADDAEFHRRLFLDLNGVIPTVEETRTFLADKNPQKRLPLIDRLLESPRYVLRMREALTVMLLERRVGNNVPTEDWNRFVESSVSANKPWDQFVRDLVEADGAVDETRGSVKFFVDGGRADHDQMTEDVARLFLGMNIHCAKCHDHPVVDQFMQSDYFGLLGYLNQSKLAKHAKLQKAFLVENAAAAKLEFQSVFFPDTKEAVGPRLPGGAEVAVPTFAKGEELSAPAQDGLPGVPKFRPRVLLARDLTAATNRRFVENSVNRFWSLLMGRGLVEPLDMMHDENPASHPAVLKLLADEFVAHRFDVRWLVRELVLSQTYQRSSRLPAGVAIADAGPRTYRVANAKGLSPEQTAWSLMRATGVLEKIQAKQRPADSKFTYKDYINRRIPPPDNLADTMLLFAAVFGNPPGEPEVGFQPSMGQALFLMNEPLVLDWLSIDGGELIELAAKQSDPQAAELLYLQILGRPATTEEATEVGEYIAAAKSREDGVKEFAWALIASAEFRLNH
ncbi:MAG: DUF1549 domain-containing protein [Pirellulaceae bacterium]|nr:DUF1549 domain-containing protein [Pirellulaceae bacterium]